MNHLIPLLLGEVNFTTPPVIEHCHHSQSFLKQSSRAGPRPILVKLLHFQDKIQCIFRCIHFNCPPYLKQYLIPFTAPYPLRHTQQPFFFVPKTNKEFSSRAFKFKAPSDWNILPNNIRIINSFCNFNIFIFNFYYYYFVLLFIITMMSLPLSWLILLFCIYSCLTV